MFLHIKRCFGLSLSYSIFLFIDITVFQLSENLKILVSSCEDENISPLLLYSYGGNPKLIDSWDLIQY